LLGIFIDRPKSPDWNDPVCYVHKNDFDKVRSHYAFWRSYKEQVLERDFLFNGGVGSYIDGILQYYDKIKGGLDGNSALTASFRSNKVKVSTAKKLLLHSVHMIVANCFIATRTFMTMKELVENGENFPGLRAFRLKASTRMPTFPSWIFRVGMKVATEPLFREGRISTFAGETAVRVPSIDRLAAGSRDKEVEAARIKTLQEKIPKRYRLKFFSENLGKELRLAKWDVPHSIRYFDKIEVKENRKLYNKNVKRRLSEACFTNSVGDNDENRSEDFLLGNCSPKAIIKFKQKKRAKCTLCKGLCSTYCSICLVPLHTTLTNTHTRESCWERFHTCEKLST